MKRRIGVAVVLAAVAAGLLFWRCSSRETKNAAPAAQTKNAGTVGSAVTPRREDPRKLQRASIAGTVTDKATKRPLAGAQICADGWSHDTPSDVFKDPTCVVADDKGVYKIENLLSANYVVSAAAKTYRPASYEHPNKKHKQSFLLAPGEAKQGIDIALDPGGVEITGTVSDISGGPVANAHVRASGGRWGGGTSNPPTETDAQGKYSLWVRPGGVRVTAGADGYANASEMGDAPGKIDLLLTPESSLTGTVVDAKSGEPIEGARVSVQSSGFGWDRESDRSDAQGKFRVHGLTPGRFVAEATTERGYGRTEGSTLVGLGQHVEGVVVRVHPALKIQGKVMIKGDKPAVCEDGFAWFRDEENNRWASGRTDPDGTITAEGVVPGTYTVQAGCRGYAAAKEKFDPIVMKDKDLVGIVWEVEAGATIKGRVLSKRGEPIADVDVNARTTGGGLRDQQRWVSDESKLDGSYELEGLRAATYLIEPSAKSAVSPREGFKVDAPAGKIVEKDLILDDGGKIEGVVVDEQGKPVEGVKINANSIENDWNFRWDSGSKSDVAGKFVIDGLRPGEYRVIASKGWFETLRKPGTTDDEQHPGEKAVVKSSETTKVRLVIEAQSGSIKGVVVDADGKPVSDAYLSAARESDAAGAQQSNVSATRDWDWGEEKPTLTNVDGTFTIPRLSPGKYTVRAYRKGGGEAVQEHVAVGSTTRLQIKHTGSIAGIAKREGGAPEEITVTLADLKTGFNRDERFYKTGGKFTIHDLPKGHFHLTVSTDGGSKKIELDLAEGEAKTGVEITLDSLVTLTGRVVEMGTQKPVPGMRVFAQLATGGGFTISWGGDTDNDNISDELGKFTVKRVPRGQIAVQGMAKEWKNSDYTWFRTLKTIDGTQANVDIGDVAVIKRRVKEGEKSGELGINFKEEAPDTPPDKQKFEVSFIDPKGPAANSGIKVGDVITSVDGVDVTGGNAMHAWTLMNAPPGTKLSLGLARNATVTVVLAAP
ncbi:MAG: carboxypeptidase regulatory-like domain-containing protein [Myxococcota bacterium]|nr:carboxypeptidase regulatory-like domain-containing protein [Myxococcota bacterium]